ncbi:tRNA pseudouridine synthase A [Alphaproteobacteria bacterium]|nr:tRNA pseudouridine synthase A [Alphaproteobacteria bacterium]
MLMRVKLLIEYDGTKFCGWQKQRDCISVQETIERAICNVFGDALMPELYGAGRTDTGVHATGQIAHLELADEKLTEKWKNNLLRLHIAINANMLQSGARVLEATEVSDDFHARFSAKMRHYKYVILNRNVNSPIYEGRVWNIRRKIDENSMNFAAQFLRGTHNFNAFRSSQCSALNPVRTISNVEVSRKGDLIIVKISAKSFLHNQVRITVGTLKEIGIGAKNPEYIKYLLESADRTQAGPTAPAFGLYLTKIDY